MITIKQLNISTDLKSLTLKVNIDNANANFTKLFLWDIHTFRDYSKATDLSYLLGGDSNIEELIISAESIGKKMFNGIYFVELRTSEEPISNIEGEFNNQILGITANIFKYKECLLDKTLRVDINGCEDKKSECNDCSENLCLLSTLLSSLDIAIISGFLKEVVKIAKDIEDLCEICHTCPDYGDTNSYNGKGLMYQVINNRILLQPVIEI